MSLLLALLASSVITAAQAEPVASALTAFDIACLRVRGDREALAALAKAKGWDSVEGGSPPAGGWQVGYWIESGAVVRLSGYPASEDGLTPAQVICAVDGIETRPGWEQTVSALPVNGAALGEGARPDMSTYRIPPGMEVKVWDLADGSRIHASSFSARSYLELSINYPTGR
ncbi:hypothetical protein GGQ87_000728 [Brevundimonas alba]|uniref:Uncharacterized protein n=1 Tax=Brevundimonas alba TaxID=74314 RepID=A0A7X5YI94_9CAUL|nr:hypothetical protein [Brevundimonas alba]NJC40470.1 hypothetical protein [Brevundimonas alba]